MRFEVIIPSFGSPGDEVRLEEWLVKPGDFIRAGAPFFVVTTDKATVEVEAYRDGIVQELVVEAGSSVPVGSVVAILGIDEGRDQDLGDFPVGRAMTQEVSPGGREKVPADTYLQKPREEKVLASPLAKRMAKEAGISLAGIQGSGKQGQVLRIDVEKALATRQVPSIEEYTGGVKARRVPISSMRRSIAERTSRSKAEAPHFYAAKTIDMTEANAFQTQLDRFAESSQLQSPTINDLILKATALALSRNPAINACLQKENILYFDEINLGLVVGLDEGMIIPVIRQADQMSLFRIAAESKRLKEEARQGKLRSSDLLGATFTLSNLGMYGLDSFTAVINPPEAGVLAIGAIKQVMAVWHGEAAIRWQVTATLSVDHRIVDGISAGKFMQELQLLLENPINLLLETPK